VQARHKPHTGRRSAPSFRLLSRLTNGRPPLAVSRDCPLAARVFELRCPKKKRFARLRAQGFCRRREDNPKRTGPFQLQFHLEGQWNFLIGLLLRSWPTLNEILWRVRQARTAPLHCSMLQGRDFVASRRLYRSLCRPNVGYHLNSAIQLIGSQKPDAQMVQLLPSKPTRASSTISGSTLTVIMVVGGIVAALYFGREVLVPIALALLLSFVLAPLVRRLQSWRFPRVVAVSIVAIFAFATIFGLGAFMVSQVSQRARTSS
jgi:AI-2E family transporter